MRRARLLAGAAALFVGLAVMSGTAQSAPPQRPSARTAPSPQLALLPSGRQLAAAGTQSALGNFTSGGAVTANGRWLWTVSTGFMNDVRIVDTRTGSVCQVLVVPGASGGIAIDSTRHLAYVAGLPLSRWLPSQANLPGTAGDVVHVFSYTEHCGQASEIGTLPVPIPAGAPPVQNYNAQRPGVLGTPIAWPDRLAVSPDGRTLLVPLNLADQAAIVDTTGSAPVRYVATGHYPNSAAITPDGRTGLVTNEGTGSLSVIDLRAGTKLGDVQVGANLSHPLGIAISRNGRTAFVAVSESDWVSVVDIPHRRVLRTINVGRPQGRGSDPVALALTPDERFILVANQQTDDLAVVALPQPGLATDQQWRVVGRIPAGSQPTGVFSFTDRGTTRIAYTTGKGRGTGANPHGPSPVNPQDPIFWAFRPNPPTFDVFDNPTQVYGATLVTGSAGVLDLPTPGQLADFTTRANAVLTPVGYPSVPARTVLRADGPIKHVFYIVRENRSYDQMLGTIGKGRSDPSLAVFTADDAVPNLHALANRFGLLDNVYADSEASIEGHAITATGTVPPYTNLNWWANYSARGRPSDQVYSISFPSTGSVFEQADKESISYFNYGEALVNAFPDLPDKDRGPRLTRQARVVAAHSDLGPPTGCYPGSYTIGAAADGKPIFDSSLLPGAPAGSYSHVDCFTQRFQAQLATGRVPTLNYLSMTGDHTLGTLPGAFTPMAMVADSDRALGQIVDLISHSSIWSSSVIFVVEDDSQDGADHVNAHRIPALVVSPYSRGGIVSSRYDLLSVLRSTELLIGMKPLTINDAMATPMYAAFAATPINAAPYDLIEPTVDLLAANPATAPGAAESRTYLSGHDVDEVPQWWLDQVIWRSVKGADAVPPPPGPDAVNEPLAPAR